MRFRSLTALGLGLIACTSGAPEKPDQLDAEASALELRGSEKVELYVLLEGPSAFEALPAGLDPRSPEAAAQLRVRLARLEKDQLAIAEQIEREGGKLVARFARLGNALQIEAPRALAERIERLPGVRLVERVPLLHRQLASAVPIMGAPEAWGRAASVTGQGVTIGIIDSGIDYTHADFGGAGTPAAYTANDPQVLEPGSFPTAKVVGGWDFVGDAYDPSAGQGSPQPDPDPLDCARIVGEQISGGHGSHVAGIAAGSGVLSSGSTFTGPYDASYDPSSFRVAPGVAPGASLHAIKIFGCDGPTTMLAPALEYAADPNDDGSFDDRLDILNLSLGSDYALGSALQAQLVKNLTAVGTLVVAASGNSGGNFFVTSSPGTYAEVLSVAASADNALSTLSIIAPSSAAQDFAAAEGSFTVRLRDVGTIEAELVFADPPQACAPFANAGDVSGKVVLMQRGSCPFVSKFENAVAAGAVAGVVIDNEAANLPFAMSGDAAPPIAIPGFMVRQADGPTLQAALAGGAVTVRLDPGVRYAGPGAELLGGFSSRGPNPSDYRLKPEIAAPGTAIDSAAVGTGTEARRTQGTSMATPAVAGAAALLLEARPELGPLEAKAVLIGSVDTLRNFSGLPYAITQQGAGRLAIDRALDRRLLAASDLAKGDVAVSFGAIEATEPSVFTRTVTVRNLGASSATVTSAVEPSFALPGVNLTASPASFELAAGASADVVISLDFDPEAFGSPSVDPTTNPTQGQTPRHYLNEANGRLLLSVGTDTIVVPYTSNLRASSARQAAHDPGCAAVAQNGGPVTVAIEGESAHPDPLVYAFELGVSHPENPESANDRAVAMTDLRAVGVATDLATAPSFEEAQVFFGVAVTGSWSTPARGPISVVVIDLDLNRNGTGDHQLRVEARNPDGPFRDVLQASLYRNSDGARLAQRPVNVVSPDIVRSHPFSNSVLVFAVGLAELGLDPEDPSFEYAASSENPEAFLAAERTDWVSFDPRAPRIDTAKNGDDGTPAYFGGRELVVDVAAEAATSPSLPLLLLHPTNLEGERFEIVELAPGAAGNLALRASGPSEAAGDAPVELRFEVSNDRSLAAGEVRLVGNIGGGELVAITSSAGSCAAGPGIACELGTVAPGASVVVTATVRPTPGAAALTASATLESALACEANASDDTASFELELAPSSSSGGASLDLTGGGCACSVTGAPERAPSGAWLATGAAMLLAARRRSERRAARG
jgi:MYXO-CTERM domain-containing protein